MEIMENMENIDGLTLEEQTQFIETAKKIGREKVRELLKKIPGGDAFAELAKEGTARIKNDIKNGRLY